MSAMPEQAAPAIGDATASLTQTAAPLASAAVDLVQAWAGLLDQELALARRSLRWCLIGAVTLPVAALGLWLSLGALLVAAAYVCSGNWFVALLLGAGVQALVLALLLRRLRHWSRDLTLPQSRAALLHAMERMT
jgi:hypothetical protein